MAKKKSGNKNSGSDFEKEKDNDMTRIEDLSSFFHKEDPEIEAFFKKANLPDLPTEDETPPTEDLGLDIAFEPQISPEEIPEETPDVDQDEYLEASQDETSSQHLDENTYFNEDQQAQSLDDSPFTAEESDTELGEDSIFLNQDYSEESPLENEGETNVETTESIFNLSEENQIESDNEFNSDSSVLEQGYDQEYSNEEPSETEHFSFTDSPTTEETNLEDENIRASKSTQVSLHDLKNENINYNQSTSFGHLPTSANPAFSLKIEDINPEYTESIIEILAEFQLLKNNSEKDYRLSLSNGSLLISQINEFLTIQLATKLKRFGAKMLMGPSDLIFNSKIVKENSPRGLHTKRIKEQTKRGSEQLNVLNTNQELDFFIHFQNTDINFEIENHLGAVTTSQIIEEEDFNRSAHAQKMINQHLENISSDDKDLYHKYANLLEHSKEKLIDVLKAKAILKNANSLNNLQFQINTQSIKNKNMIIIQAHANADIIRVKTPASTGEEKHES